MKLFSFFTPNFIKRLGRVRRIFTKALEKSQKLNAQMEATAAEKTEEANRLLVEVTEINTMKEKNNSFMNKLNDLLN